MSRIIVAGSRTIKDIGLVKSVIDLAETFAGLKITTLICGKCEGVDSIAEKICKSRNIKIEEYPVTKDDWNKYGKSAGPRRNKKMADKADGLIAICSNKSRGTTDMIKQWKDLNGDNNLFVYYLDSNEKI